MRFSSKKGSSTIMLAMVFVTFAICITSSISISRALAVRSECEAFGRVWSKAILSEYDVHLLKDYKIMAYWGNEFEVQNKLDSYMNYSMSSKMDAVVTGSSAELSGYELADVENFRTALNKGLTSEIADNLKNNGRAKRAEEPKCRYIKNKVVLDTLPSSGVKNSLDIDSIKNKLESVGGNWSIKDIASGGASEYFLIRNTMSNRVTKSNSKEGYFSGEWEYIINGKADDEANYKDIKIKLFLIRNALNLAYLYKDPEKVEVIAAAAELITPGPAAIATQAVIAELWAAAESNNDVEALLENKRVPFIKTSATWQAGIEKILSKKKIRDLIEEENEENFSEKEGEILAMKGAREVKREITEGQTYDDYLLVMMTLMNDHIRILRIMDLIQINMKYRYYEDFNMMEYYTGVAFSLKANGRSYDFQDRYE